MCFFSFAVTLTRARNSRFLRSWRPSFRFLYIPQAVYLHMLLNPMSSQLNVSFAKIAKVEMVRTTWRHLFHRHFSSRSPGSTEKSEKIGTASATPMRPDARVLSWVRARSEVNAGFLSREVLRRSGGFFRDFEPSFEVFNWRWSILVFLPWNS